MPLDCGRSPCKPKFAAQRAIEPARTTAREHHSIPPTPRLVDVDRIKIRDKLLHSPALGDHVDVVYACERELLLDADRAAPHPGTGYVDLGKKPVIFGSFENATSRSCTPQRHSLTKANCRRIVG